MSWTCVNTFCFLNIFRLFPFQSSSFLLWHFPAPRSRASEIWKMLRRRWIKRIRSILQSFHFNKQNLFTSRVFTKSAQFFHFNKQKVSTLLFNSINKSIGRSISSLWIVIFRQIDGQGGRASPTKGLDRKKSKGPPGRS